MGMLGVMFCLVYLQSINYSSVLKSSIFSIFSGSYHFKIAGKNLHLFPISSQTIAVIQIKAKVLQLF